MLIFTVLPRLEVECDIILARNFLKKLSTSQKKSRISLSTDRYTTK